MASLVSDSLEYKSFEGLKIGFNQVECFYLIKNVFNIFFFLFVKMAPLTPNSLGHESFEGLEVSFNQVGCFCLIKNISNILFLSFL